MSQQNREQIGSLEQELEKAEHDFRKAAESTDMQAVLHAHNRICQLVANLSALWSESGKPTVFSRFYVGPSAIPSASTAANSTAVSSSQAVPSQIPPVPPLTFPSVSTTAAATTSGATPTSPNSSSSSTPTTAASSSSTAPAAAPETEDFPDIAELEKQLADLASKMQKCLEVGDMDGMLQANEKMGTLSELMGKAEARAKAKKAEQAGAAAGVGAAAASKSAGSADGAKASAGGWAAGDTMALAKQRAQERKKQQKLNDSFDVVVGEVTDKAAAAAASADPKTDMFFSSKMQAKLKESGEQKPSSPSKKPMTQEQLREKLEQYSFYEILSIPSTASFEQLHRSFLRKIKRLNARLYLKELEDWQFQEFVAALCLAHDVLKFPNARLQYDLVLFGPDGGITPESAAKQKLMPLKEMIKFSTLVNGKELSEAIERNKANSDERELGRDLIEKGLLSEEEFDSILFAQKLVSNGKLTVAQFELAMQEMRENSIPLLDTLVASEWIQPQDVFSAELG